ncbi:MAG: FG-GAP-like repeat-containing protein [Chloroflexota bacterium]
MRKLILGTTTLFLSALIVAIGSAASTQAAPPRAIAAPVLKWQRGGCYASWCETGWYSSPAVADLDGNGSKEVIAAAYSVFILDGATGAQTRRIDPPVSGARAWPSVVVADIDGNGDLEIVTAHGSGYLRVLDHSGNVVWTRQPIGNELRSLAAYDLDGDGKLEILVAAAASINYNQWYVYQFDGTLRSGWPQLGSGQPGYAAGAYNENIGVADLDGDGRGEIIGPSDVHYITAYEDNGAQIRAHTRYGSNKFWSQVGVHVDDAVDLRGYAYCGTEHRPNFADTAPTLVDVNRDGVIEVIVVGNVYNCGTNPYTDLYHMPFIFKADRSRWSGSGFDWTTIPVPDGQAAPLSENYNLIETALPNPVAADLDGDGNLEILYASYDGRIHAYWLDKTEHGNFPYSVYNSGEGFYRFASEPVVADLDNDGYAEVIFASWVQKGTLQTGKLHILDYQGNALQTVNLPAAFGSPNWNGVLAAPTLADIDNDGELEVVLNSAHSGVVAYDLPGTSNARILWGTGRGNYQRTGSFLSGSLQSSSKSVAANLPRANSALTYTITLQNPGPALTGVRVTDTLPAEVNYLGNLNGTTGTWGYASGVITWTGSVSTGAPVTITFSAAVRPEITNPQVIVNTAQINDGLSSVLQRQAIVVANGIPRYLPFVKRQ